VGPDQHEATLSRRFRPNSEVERMSFCTVVNCMDGRVQLPVFTYLQKRFDARFVDTVTEAGPVQYLSARPDSNAARSMFRRIDVSIETHGSTRIAVAAHHDCAGNPVADAAQKRQLAAAASTLARRYPRCEVIGLWVDADWAIEEIPAG
jgi:carbonic anhydrase